MIDPLRESTPTSRPSRWSHVVDAGLITLFVAVLYRGAASIGILSDGWHLLHIASKGFVSAAKTVLSYHFIPIAHLFNALLWKLFGLWQMGYQLTNLALFALVATLLAHLGRTLGFSRLQALVAALLLVANASFFEVTFWPVVGSLQSLAVIFYLLGLFAAHRAAMRPSFAAWATFALATAAAFFTYEPTITLVPVGLLLAAFASGRGLSRENFRRLLGLAVAAAIAVGLCLAIKRGIVTSTDTRAVYLPQGLADWNLRGFYFVRALVALATLRGSDGAIETVLSFGGPPLAAGTAPFDQRTYLWLGIAAFAAVLTLWRAKTWTTRWLMLWLGLHLAAIGLAIGIVSRHYYLAAIPASLLLVRFVSELTAFASRRFDEPTRRRVEAFVLPSVVALALAAGAARDLDRAREVWGRASNLHRPIVEGVRAQVAAGNKTGLVVLVNLPAKLFFEGVHAHAFLNGSRDLVRLVSRDELPQAIVANTYFSGPEGSYPVGSVPFALGDLARLASDTGNLTLVYDPRRGETVRADLFTFRAERSLSFESTGMFDWQGEGDWHYLPLGAGRPFELPLTPAAGRWIAFVSLAGSGGQYSWSADPNGGPLREAPAPTLLAPAWVANVAALPAAATRVTIRPTTEVLLKSLKVFDPPKVYTPEEAPFLEWTRTVPLAFTTRAPITLPLAAAHCRPECKVVVRYLAEPGREFKIRLGDRSFDAGPERAGTAGWREFEISTSEREVIALEIHPGPGSPPLISGVEAR